MRQQSFRFLGFVPVLCLLGFHSASAKEYSCVSLESGIPQYMDTLEGRCSPCSSGVCKNQRPLPGACKCFCAREHPSGDRNLEQMPWCVNEQNTIDPTTPTPSPSQTGIYIWLSVLTLLVFLVLVFLLIRHFKKRKEPAKPGEGELLLRDDDRNNNPTINIKQKGNNMEMVEKDFKVTIDHTNESPQASSLPIPEQESQPGATSHVDRDLTPEKTVAGGPAEGPRPRLGVLEVDPHCTKEGVPGDYRLYNP